MLQNIKHLIKHSFIYSISNVAQKASGIILLPLYTSYFSVEEYGRLGLILVTIVLISQSLILGQGVSLIRFNNSLEFRGKKESILFTLTIIIVVVSAIFILLTQSLLSPIANLFGDADLYRKLLEIAIYIIVFTTLNNLFLSKLRADDNSLLYTSSMIIKVILMVALSVYLIVEIQLGIEAVLYSQLAGEVLQSLLVLPVMIKQMKFKFERDLISPSLKFGLPLIFSSMAINLLNGSDRFILKFLSGETVLGLYELGYRVAGVINMFVIMPFGLTLMPIAYKIYKQDGDKEYYKKLKTYVAFVLVWAGLALSFYSKEIVSLFASQEAFYDAHTVVPLIVLAYILYGLSMISSLGMYLTGNNNFIAVITIICAGLNIGLNFWLIPQLGMIGAALNTVIAYLLLDVLSNISSNKHYKINYEYFKLMRLFFAAILVFMLSFYFNELELIQRILFKLLIVIIFPLIVLIIGYFDRNELNAIKGTLKKWSNPSKWKVN